MKVLMLGWEFPPFSIGGLGTACYSLVNELSRQTELSLILPCRAKRIAGVKFFCSSLEGNPYSKNPNFFSVHEYKEFAKKVAMHEEFDVVHAHDWMTFPAAIEIKRMKKKPLVVHVHATEFDRSGGNSVNEYVYNIEKKGMEEADAVIAVSSFTKQKIIRHYGIAEKKISVVHNAVSFDAEEKRKIGKKIVLFLGRITLQKGPEYFVYAAKKVLEYEDAIFVMAGSGEMQDFVIRKAAELGIADKLLFTGYLSDEEVKKVFALADLYVMPSVSEPFGIVALEALAAKVPVIISKQSGVSEVIKHCLKVDFWDVDEMANKIIAVLRHEELQKELARNGNEEASKLSWEDAVKKCLGIYEKIKR